MAFFDASLSPNPSSTGEKTVAMNPVHRSEVSSVVKRSSAAQIQQKRASINSISDEIIGDDDLRDVDAVFESLLNSTFQEIQARGRDAGGRAGSKKRSVSSHPTTRSSEVGNASRSAAGDSTSVKSSNTASAAGPSQPSKRGAAVNRKQSRNKQDAVKTVIVDKSDSNMPNKEILADPLGALPTSHTKKYLPRQQTWANPSSPLPSPPAVQTPSPTQSEYDTCPDPWDDY